MKQIGILLLSTVVGAGIGGLTNYIAIFMLFRPYVPKRLGSWRLPFTPGLIPKRQTEIALQLGELVEKHLINVKVVENKLNSPSFQNQLEVLIKQELRHALTSEKEVQQLWQSLNSAKRGTRNPLLNNMTEHFSKLILHRGKDFLYSQEGEDFLYQFSQNMIESQGTFAGMIGKFITKDKMIHKLQEPLVQWLDHPHTQEKVQSQLILFVNETFMQKTIREVFKPWRNDILTLVPVMIEQLRGWMITHHSQIFEQLHIKKIVQQQVLTFPMSYLEKIVRDLSKKELKMITWLGAFLGGIVGLVQAVILLWILW